MSDETKTTTRVTRELLRQRGACYYDEEDGEAKVDALVPPEGLTALEVLSLAIPATDRLWVATLNNVCPPAVQWRWQALLVERALGRVENPDTRSLAVVPLLRRLGDGEDVPQTERAATRDAALAAALDAVGDAAWAAAWAAWAAARDAAWASASRAARAATRAAALDAVGDAARDAEKQQQIEDLRNLFTEYAR
jgi:hypothetical protein